MRRLTFMVLFLLANVSLQASEIDSLYNVFLASKGELAIDVANEIAVMTGDTACFTTDFDAGQLNEAVLKKVIYWHFDRSEMTEVVNYAKIAIDGYEKRGDLFDAAGCYNLLGVAYQRLGQLNDAIESYNQWTPMLSTKRTFAIPLIIWLPSTTRWAKMTRLRRCS